MYGMWHAPHIINTRFRDADIMTMCHQLISVVVWVFYIIEIIYMSKSLGKILSGRLCNSLNFSPNDDEKFFPWP